MPSRDPKRPGRQWYGTSRWQKLRRLFLDQNPTCAMCREEGKLAIATVVDHIKPHKGDEKRFWNGPFQALCKPCHDSVKQRLEKSGVRPGCSDDGVPLDPQHHWR